MKYTAILALFAAGAIAMPVAQGGRGFQGGNNGGNQNNAAAPQGNQQQQGQQGGQQGQQGGQADPNAQQGAPAQADPTAAAAAPPATDAANANQQGQQQGAGQQQQGADQQQQGGDQAAAAPADGGAAAGGTQGPVDPAQVPDFGVQPGQNNQNGNCDGAVAGVKIPCACPPSKDDFVAKMNEFLRVGQVPDGTKITFPTGNSADDQRTRIQTSLNVLQNFNGQAGQGCPASATTFLQQIKDVQG